MKRRAFIAGAALLSLFGTDAWAVRRKAAAKKKAGRHASRTSAKGSPKKPAGPTARTADQPMIDRPPEGSSASRLPPVKAAEPPAEWRTYEITTSVKVKPGTGKPRLWLPLPLNQDTLYQRTIGHQWKGNAEVCTLRRMPDGDLETFYAEWGGDSEEPKLLLTTLVMTADRHFDVTKRTVAPEREDILRRNLQASAQIPNDGPAHQLAVQIVGRIKDPVAQAKAVFDWVVDHATYNLEWSSGYGGDVRKQFETRQFGGRSLEINGLFVALCRAIGIPARRVYGLRLGSSRLFGKLGLTSDDATQGQHCRAEFYIPGYGWIPVDASDVRRAVALEGLGERDNRLTSLKKILFGVWEMNWMAYNLGVDLTLPGGQVRLPFFMRPRLESGENGADSGLEYSIRARRVEL